MWFINPRTVGLWSSLLQDAVDARDAQGKKEFLKKESGKFSQIIHQLPELKTLLQKDSIHHTAKAFKCPMEILYIFFLFFSFLFLFCFQLLSSRWANPEVLKHFWPVLLFEFNFPAGFWYS